MLRFLHGGCSRKGLDQKLCLNIICSIRASGSFGLFVGQCVASLETSQSDVTEIFFVSSLCAVFSVWEWQVQQSVCQLLVRACARRSQGKHVLRSKNEWIVRFILSALWRSVT